MPSWNPTLVECKTIQPIDEHTDISYQVEINKINRPCPVFSHLPEIHNNLQVCAEAGGGVVSTRDFVNLRHWALVDGVYVSAGGSVNHPAMPPQVICLSDMEFYQVFQKSFSQSKKVRGENGPGCWAMRPVEGQPDRCLFQWLLDTDIKVTRLSLFL